MVSKRLLPLIPAGLVVDRVVTDTERVIITTHPSATRAACPACGQLSSRTHSHYARTLADLPWQGRPVAIRVRARRFRCATVECPRQVFAERLPSVAPSRARRSQRLSDIQRHISLAVGGEPGSRLAHRLAMPVSGDTLLRLIRSARWEAPQAPRVIGTDEWAWKRGQTYGTILCDLEKGRVLDLLPDREAGTVSAWLKQHLGVTVIARDRATVFARAIRDLERRKAQPNPARPQRGQADLPSKGGRSSRCGRGRNTQPHPTPSWPGRGAGPRAPSRRQRDGQDRRGAGPTGGASPRLSG